MKGSEKRPFLGAGCPSPSPPAAPARGCRGGGVMRRSESQARTGCARGWACACNLHPAHAQCPVLGSPWACEVQPWNAADTGHAWATHGTCTRTHTHTRTPAAIISIAIAFALLADWCCRRPPSSSSEALRVRCVHVRPFSWCVARTASPCSACTNVHASHTHTHTHTLTHTR